MIPFAPCEKIAGAFLGRLPINLREEFFQVEQVHGDTILTIQSPAEAKAKAWQQADAVICSVWGIPIAVRTADCVPILIAHPSRVIAAVHAGWRGSAADILQKTIAVLQRDFGLSPREMQVAIGPAICASCYEVGEEVAEVFKARGETDALAPRSDRKFSLDLKKINAAQARAAGVSESKMEICDECTRCQEDLFYSHRGALARGAGNEGRNYSWVMVSP